MTIRELSKLYFLKKEIALNESQLVVIEADIQQTREQIEALKDEIRTGGIGSPVISDMPKGPQSTDSIPERLALQMASLEERLMKQLRSKETIRNIIAARTDLLVFERERLETYINTIPDEDMRIIFTNRFVNGMTWREVADSLGDRYKGDSVRRIANRYVGKN